MKKPKSNVNDLLAAIKRTPAETAAIPSKSEVSDEPTNAKTTPSRKSENTAREVNQKNRVGKPVQFWMHDEERNLVRELSAWVAGQGIRPTDSMIIRATLRFAKTGGAFLEAYRAAALMDGRLKRD